MCSGLEQPPHRQFRKGGIVVMSGATYVTQTPALSGPERRVSVRTSQNKHGTFTAKRKTLNLWYKGLGFNAEGCKAPYSTVVAVIMHTLAAQNTQGYVWWCKGGICSEGASGQNPTTATCYGWDARELQALRDTI